VNSSFLHGYLGSQRVLETGSESLHQFIFIKQPQSHPDSRGPHFSMGELGKALWALLIFHSE
jgi:hypothetical protein